MTAFDPHPSGVGDIIRGQNCLVFFGNSQATRDILPLHFSHFDFLFLKQVHGTDVVEAKSLEIEADGHWTNQKNTACLIATADCIPILIEGENGVAALHAGWRGVAGNILASGHESARIGAWRNIFIGPHIRFSNFEVHRDVAQKILSASPVSDQDLTRPHESDSSKVYVNLTQVVLNQLAEICDQRPVIHSANTYTQKGYWSFRRQGNKAQRLWSFIAWT